MLYKWKIVKTTMIMKRLLNSRPKYDLIQIAETRFGGGAVLGLFKVVMQRKLFQKCTHLLYCSVLSLGGNVNTIRMLQPDMGAIIHIKNQ